MSYHSDDDTYDPNRADPDIRKAVECKTAGLTPKKSTKEGHGSVEVYCRGKLANGEHDFAEISKVEKSGYVETDKVLGFQRRKKVFYIETTLKCVKCGAKEIRREGKRRPHYKHIPAERGGKFDSPGRTIDLSEGASRLSPNDYKYFDQLPSGVPYSEWLG